MAGASREEALRDAAARFEEYLRTSGLNVTAARREILDEVFRSNDHFDAKGLLRRLRTRGRRVSRATTYRTLDLLVAAKIIMRLDFGDGEAHYELLHGRAHHDHFVCVRCGRIIEFTSDAIEKILARTAREYRFSAETHELHVHGRCSRCRDDAPR